MEVAVFKQQNRRQTGESSGPNFHTPPSRVILLICPFYLPSVRRPKSQPSRPFKIRFVTQTYFCVQPSDRFPVEIHRPLEYESSEESLYVKEVEVLELPTLTGYVIIETKKYVDLLKWKIS